MKPTCQKKARGATLVETCVAVALVSLVFVSFYAALTAGFATTKLIRENLRATQILVQRMETIRLYRWSQIVGETNPVYVPASFTEYFDPAGKSSNSAGAVYTGKITKTTPADLPSIYGTNMRLITVEVSWNSGNVPRKRVMETYVARYGMQNHTLE